MIKMTVIAHIKWLLRLGHSFGDRRLKHDFTNWIWIWKQNSLLALTPFKPWFWGSKGYTGGKLHQKDKKRFILSIQC